MFDVIMVPIDGSEYSFKAADVAIEIAQKFSSKIAAVHVLEEFSFNSYDSEEDSGDELLAKIEEYIPNLKNSSSYHHIELVDFNKYIEYNGEY